VASRGAAAQSHLAKRGVRRSPQGEDGPQIKI